MATTDLQVAETADRMEVEKSFFADLRPTHVQFPQMQQTPEMGDASIRYVTTTRDVQFHQVLQLLCCPTTLTYVF